MEYYTDPRTGRQYYVDPATGQSRWVDSPPGPPGPATRQVPTVPPDPTALRPRSPGRRLGAGAWAAIGGAAVTLLILIAAAVMTDPGAVDAGAPVGNSLSPAATSPSGSAPGSPSASTGAAQSPSEPAAPSTKPRSSTAAPTTQATTRATTRTSAPPEPEPEPSCDPNYTGACVPIASDVDCLGGGGNGPAYVQGPVIVVGKDIYRLDGDHDGIGCE
ncbi:MAG: hypothetical protein P8Z68_01250 [Kineosporiaceae bacterium]